MRENHLLFLAGPLLLLFASIPLVKGSDRYSERFYCQLDRAPIAVLSRSETTGETILIEKLHPLTPLPEHGNFRLLQVEDMEPSSKRLGSSSWMPGIEVINGTQHFEMAEIGTSSNSSLFYARECSCFGENHPTVYCPMTVSTCLRPKRGGNGKAPGCMNRIPGGSFGGVTFVGSIVIYFGVVVYMMCSSMGQNVRDYIFSRCSKRWNDAILDDILQDDDPVRTERRIQEIFDVRPQILEHRIEEESRATNNSAGQRTHLRPKALLLKTKRYRADETKNGNETEESSDSEYDHQCSICYTTLETGEKVGHLTCDHAFHVDCLKLWLQRRNVCPLCQTTTVAKVQYDEVKEGAGGDESSVEVPETRHRATGEVIP